MEVALKVVIDEELRHYYLEDDTTLFFDNGQIWTTDFDNPRLARLIDYIETSENLHGGRFYGMPPVVIKVESATLEHYRVGVVNYSESSLEEEEDDSTSDVKDRLWYVMQQAVDKGSSDIHIEVHRKTTEIYCRVDGRRVLIGNKINDPNYGREIFSVIFLDIAKDKTADFNINTANAGRIEHTLIVKDKDKKGNVTETKRNTIWRGSFIPSRDNGGKVSLRWLNKSETIPDLEVLGYTKGQYEQILNFIRRSKGVFLLSGVTNSGKSTLIAAMIKKSKQLYSGRSHHTVEDPPEFELGVIQTHIQANQKVFEGSDECKDYNHYTKVLLRQDPDVVVVGEVREHNVAMETCRLGDTGQLVMATLHTSSAVGIGETFINQFKVDSAVMATPDLMCIWATQTLVRTLCSHCKLSTDEAKPAYEKVGLISEIERGLRVLSVNSINSETLLSAKGVDYKDIYWRNPVGCEHCYKGEKGLTSVLEMIIFDDEDRGYLVRQDYLGWHHRLQEKGFQELKDHALMKIRTGLIDINTATDRVPTMFPQKSADVYKTLLD